MTRTIFKRTLFIVGFLFLVACDNYEFPESPYPKVETLSVADLSITGVTFRAKITQLVDEEIINHGFVWGPYENPSLEDDNKVELGSISSLGIFETDFDSDFDAGETYHVRAFVATDTYLVYGESVSFTIK